MSHGGGGPPAGNDGPKFQFLRRGTGTQKYQKINYITPKSSGDTNSTPMSRAIPSTSTALDVDTEPSRPPKVPQLNLLMSPNDYHPQTERDSGRGSAQEHIYSAPTNRRADSGYGDYQNAEISPERSTESPLEQTFVNDQSTTFIQPHPAEAHPSPNVPPSVVSTGDDDVFADENHSADSKKQDASLSSFMRNEEAVGRAEYEEDGETQLSTPTRELLHGVQNREPSTSRVRNVEEKTMESQTSGSESHSPVGPFSSTPIHDVTFEPPIPAPRLRETVLNTETPILRGYNNQGSVTNSACSTRAPSSASMTTPPASFQLRATSDEDSLKSERRLIGPNDRPLREAFPDRQLDHFNPRTLPGVRASQSTQFPPRNRYQHPTTSSEDELRRAALLNNARGRGPSREPFEDDFRNTLSRIEETPLRKRLPQSKDPVVRELRKQLRAAIAHTDLALAHLHDKEKELRRIFGHKSANLEEGWNKLRQEQAHLEEERDRLQMERQEWELEKKRELTSYKKDRQALVERENERTKHLQMMEKECNDQTVAAKTGAASLRVALNKKEQEIKDLKQTIEKMTSLKTKMGKNMEQMKINHNRELKKKNDRISELEKQRVLHEAQNTRRRNGIQPRPKPPSETIPSRSQSLPLTNYDEPQHESYDFYEAVQLTDMSETSTQRRVKFNLEANQYQEFPNFWTAEFTGGMTQQSPMRLPMGLCHPFVDEQNRTTYMYELCHNGSPCGSRLFKFHNNNSTWLYGPLEVFYFHRFPVVVKIPILDLKIMVLKEQVEIHRPHLEISRYNIKKVIVLDTRKRKDGTGYYAVKTNANTSQCEIIGDTADQNLCEDEMASRRSALEDHLEFMNVLEGGTVGWKSGPIGSPDVQDWLVLAHRNGEVTIRVTLENETIDIFASPSDDLVFLTHKKGNRKSPCCDIGKAARERERSGEFVACGKEILNRFFNL